MSVFRRDTVRSVQLYTWRIEYYKKICKTISVGVAHVSDIIHNKSLALNM